MKIPANVLTLLTKVPLFRDLTPDELADFLDHCRQESLRPGYKIIEQGEHGRHLFAVMSGTLSVSRLAPDGMSDIPLATIGPGEVFGELALVDFGERSASVTTNEAVRVLRFDRMDVIKLQPMLLAKLYRNVGMAMAERLRHSNKSVTMLLAEKIEPAEEPMVDGFTPQAQRRVLHRG